MNKILRISLLVTLCMFFGMSYAQTKFNFDDDVNCYKMFGLKGMSQNKVSDGDFTEAKTSTAVNGITLTVSAAKGTGVPNRIWNKAPRLRLYSGSLTVASSDAHIKKIVFQLHNMPKSAKWGEGKNKQKKYEYKPCTVNVGALSAYEKDKSTDVTWTGDASSVELTVMANTQIRNILVYTDAPVKVEKAADIAAFKALPVNTVAELTLTNAQVVYAWKSKYGTEQAFVRDATGALVFHATGLALKANQTLNGTVTLGRDKYKDIIEAVKVDGTTADKLTIADGAAAEPKAITIGEAEANLYDLVKLTDVSIVEDNGKYFAVSGADKMQIFDGFHLGLELSAGEHQDIVGILSVYNGKAQIQPISAPIATGVHGVKVAHESDAPAYNMAGQRVGAGYKGVVIQNGKKFVRK